MCTLITIRRGTRHTTRSRYDACFPSRVFRDALPESFGCGHGIAIWEAARTCICGFLLVIERSASPLGVEPGTVMVNRKLAARSRFSASIPLKGFPGDR